MFCWARCAGETRRYKSLSHGPAPSVVVADGMEAAAEQVSGFIKAFREGKSDAGAPTVCVIASSEKNREALAKQVLGAGIACVTITAQANHADSRDAVHFATMHRANGLEFDAVVVVAPESHFGEPAETGTSAGCCTWR